MTTPIDWPVYGKMKDLKLSKERLLAFWQMVAERKDFHAHLNAAVEHIQLETDGLFTVQTTSGRYRSRAVVLAIGRSGTPRKLGVPGEELPKVMYRLIEAEHYTHKKILVVGGGDSAVEAAIGLSLQPGNTVTLSYRGREFSRIKERNAQRLREAQKSGRVSVLLNSTPTGFTDNAVQLQVSGAAHELANDYVWIFAGGVAPNEFLKRCGVQFGSQDLTLEASQEALTTKSV